MARFYSKTEMIKMGREPSRASGNAYFEARKKAAEWNERLSSREGAADELQVSIDVVVLAENDKYKEMPRYIVERMLSSAISSGTETGSCSPSTWPRAD